LFANVLDVNGKMMVYNSFVQSHFNYCSLIWHLCNDKDSIKIEKVQFRALQYIYNDNESTYGELLERSNSISLYETRLKNLLHEMYKILKQLSPSYLYVFFKEKESVYDFRKCLLVMPKYETCKYGKNSLKYKGARLWNEMDSIVLYECEKASNVNNILGSWSFECQCGFCILCKIKHM